MPTPQNSLTGHGSQTAYTSAAQQTEQQGLGLIVTVLAGEQHIPLSQPVSERGVTRLPGSLLDARTRIDVYPNQLKCHTQRLTNLPTMFRPRIGCGLQAVMNMNGV